MLDVLVTSHAEEFGNAINGAAIEIVTPSRPDALPLIRHDAAHVMAEAVQGLFPGTQVTIGPVIENGFYYDFARNQPFTPEDLSAIEKKMREIIARDKPFTKETWDREKTKQVFRDKGGEAYVRQMALRAMELSKNRAAEIRRLLVLGGLGAALAFAARDPIRNVFAFAYMVLDPPFQLGDRVRMEEFRGGIAAEGTRSKADHWKSGFYRLSQQTGLPITLAFIDGPSRTVGAGPTFTPTGDLGADMDRIRAFYADKRGIHPEQRTEPRLRNEA